MNSITSKIQNGYDYLLESILVKRMGYRSIFDPKRKKVWEAYELSNTQKKEIDHFYKQNYGKRIPYFWHMYYTAYTGIFDEKYIPETIYIPEVEFCFNSKRHYWLTASDKNFLPFIFSGGGGYRIPHNYLSCTYGLYRDSSNRIIDKEQAIKNLATLSECFIKPSIDSSSGVGCRVLNMHDGIDTRTKDTAEEIIRDYKDNFTIQEKVVCHDSLRKLSPDSVNTFRVMSYIWNNEIHVAPAVLRIGRTGKDVDNAHAGGLFVGIESDGSLCDKAFTEMHDIFTEHPDTHVEFKDYQIPLFKKVGSAAYEAHARIPQIGIINWDFTVDHDGKVVLIEGNMRYGSCWLIQMAHGVGMFEDNTADILRYLKNKRKEYPFSYK